MRVNIGSKFVEAISVMHGRKQIEAVPGPVEAFGAFPFVPALIRCTWVGGPAGQVSICRAELSQDEPLEKEFIQISGLCNRGECPPWRHPLVLQTEIPAARLLITDVRILRDDTGDISTNVALDRFSGQQRSS